jgi:Flp pilus assembly protein TadB
VELDLVFYLTYFYNKYPSTTTQVRHQEGVSINYCASETSRGSIHQLLRKRDINYYASETSTTTQVRHQEGPRQQEGLRVSIAALLLLLLFVLLLLLLLLFVLLLLLLLLFVVLLLLLLLFVVLLGLLLVLRRTVAAAGSALLFCYYCGQAEPSRADLISPLGLR